MGSGGGAGLLFFGHIMMDVDRLERPSNGVIDCVPDNCFAISLRNLATAATKMSAQLWAKLNHGGRQTPNIFNP
tara:strand:- start:511 stop:732 length:222 start_codon:yes stop_codon:yes gene_type:complete